MMDKDFGLWTPNSKKNISIMDIWKDATYFVTLPIAGTKWTLLTEASVAPLQGYLYQATIVNLILISCLFVVAIILSQIVGKRLVRTPVRLAAISRDIPIKLEKHSELIWPVSNISEMHFLIENFKETTEALSLQYQNIKDTNIHLEERVQRRTTELRESEAKYRLIAENTADLISIMDRNLRFTYVSPASMRLLGFTAEEAMERTLEQVLTPESMRLCLTVFEKEMQLEASGTADPDRTRILELEEYKKDGSIIWVEVNLSFIRDNDRKPINILIVSRDITVRKRAEEKLRESEARFQQLFQTMEEGFATHEIICDAAGRPVDYRFLSMNPSFERLTGLKKEDLIGRTVLEVMPATEKIWIENYGRVALGGEPMHVEMDSGALGKVFAVSAFSPRKGQFAVSFHDITGRKQAELEKDRLNRELVAQKEDMENYLYIATHDLRGPLINIQGFSRELGGYCEELHRTAAPATGPGETKSRALELTGESIPEALDIIGASVVKMSGMLDVLLKMSRLGSMPLRVEPVDTDAALKAALTSLSFQLEQSGGAVTVGALPPCAADPGIVGQLFSNLLDNAIKYRDRDRKLQISVKGERKDEKTALYTFSDNGLGIKDADLTKIWRLFYRGHARHPGVEKGEGIGLTMIKRMVERSGGGIRVESKAGAGTTFFIELPATDPAPAGD
jgi:PAS domain S-box-containing protein